MDIILQDIEKSESSPFFKIISLSYMLNEKKLNNLNF